MSLFADYEPLQRGGAPIDGLSVRPATLDDLSALVALRVARGDATESVSNNPPGLRPAAEAHRFVATDLAAAEAAAVLGSSRCAFLARPRASGGFLLPL